MPPFEGFAIGPPEAATGELSQRRERGPETVRDGEQRAVPIPHRAARRVDQRAPTIQLWLDIPQPAFGWRQLETAALNRTRRIRDQQGGAHGV